MQLNLFKQKLVRISTILLMLSSLVACGGGSSSNGTPSTPVVISSSAPSSFSSSSNISTSSSNSLSSLSSQQNTSSSSKSSPAVSVLMGGAIQGKTLNISTLVSTFAGAAPWADGMGRLARFSLPSGITSDGTNLYIADSNNHIIRRVVIASGEVTTIAGKSGKSGNADGVGTSTLFNFPEALTYYGTNLYVLDGDVIRKINIQTGVVTTIAGQYGRKGGADGIGAEASFNNLSDSHSDITTDGSYLYIADSGNHTIRKVEIATNTVSTIAGTLGISGSADGSGQSAQFNSPGGITIDNTTLYISDTLNHTIRKISLSTNQVTTLAGTAGSSGKLGNNILIGASARFDHPMGLASDGTNLYIANNGSNIISKIDIASARVSKFAGDESNAGSTDGTATGSIFFSATFNKPSGIIFGGDNIFIADSFNGSIRKIEPATALVTTIAGRYRSAENSNHGIGAAANFNNLRGITTDGANLYITDTSTRAILRANIASGEVTVIAGSLERKGTEDGIGINAGFMYPYSITNDGTNLYVADIVAGTIRKIVINTGEVTTFAGAAFKGLERPRIKDGTGAEARFFNLQGITTDGTNIYVVELTTIRKIVIATGTTSIIAGSDTDELGHTDGTGAGVQFNNPDGITTDGTNLYIADKGNAVIRKIVIENGMVSTIAGSAKTHGNSDGIGTEARFQSPSGITCDGANLYVSDIGNQNIRKIEIATGLVTTLAGSPISGSADGIGTVASFNEPSNVVTDGFSLYVTDTKNQTVRKIQ